MAEDRKKTNSQKLCLDRVISAIRACKGVTIDTCNDETVSISLALERGNAKIVLAGPSNTYATQKKQFANLRDILTSLGIEEGASYTPPPLPKRGMTPMIQKSRAQQKQDFEAWQDVWRRIRAAEKNLDLEFELRQMMDYY